MGLLDSTLGKVYIEVRAELKKLAGDFKEGFSQVDAQTQGFAARFREALGPKLVMGVGAAMTGLAMPLEHLGSQLEQSEKQLKAAADAAGISMHELEERTKGLVPHMENLGHKENETNEALRNFVQGGRPAEELQKDMAMAADLAAAKHMSLAEAASLLVKVYGGNSKVLKQFGIDVKAMADPVKDLAKAQDDATKAVGAEEKAVEANRLAHMRYDEAKKHSAVQTEELRLSDLHLREAHEQVTVTTDNLRKAQEGATEGHTRAGDAIEILAKKIHGQGAAAVDTFAGKLRVLKVHFEDIVAHIGAKLGPALMMLGPLLTGVGGAMQFLAARAAVAAPAELAAGTAAATSSGGFFAMAAGIWATLAPFALIALAIAAVIAVIILLWKNWDTVWGAITAVFGPIVGFIRDHLGIIAVALAGPLAPLVLLAEHWRQVWGVVREVIGSVAGFIEDRINNIRSIIEGIIHFFERLWQRATEIVHDVEGAVGRVTHAVGALNPFGGHFLGFAAGGTVPGPVGAARLAVVHGGEEIRPYGAGGGGDTRGGAPAVVSLRADVNMWGQLLRLLRGDLHEVTLHGSAGF